MSGDTTSTTPSALDSIRQDLKPIVRDLEPVFQLLKWLKWLVGTFFIIGSTTIGIAIWVHNVDANAADIRNSMITTRSDLDIVTKKQATVVSVQASVLEAIHQQLQAIQDLQKEQGNQQAVNARLIAITDQINSMVKEHEKFILAHGWPDPNHPH